MALAFLWIIISIHESAVDDYDYDQDDSSILFEDRRLLSPGGNKAGSGSSSSNTGEVHHLYDFNELYEEHLNYTKHFNEEHIYQY